MTGNPEKREHGRMALVFISYAALLLPILALGLIGALRILKKMSPFDPSRRASPIDALLILAATAVVTTLLIYAANVVWLMVARRVFTRREAARLVFWGPTSRFDRWLFNKAFPEPQDRPRA